MSFLLELFPILIFFISYKLSSIYVATGLAIFISLIQITYKKIKSGYFDKTATITFFILLVFGGATLILKNETYIKLKPTAVYWIFSLIFILSPFFKNKKTILEYLIGKNVYLPKRIWKILNISWIIFFLSIGFVNIWVVNNFNTDTWVNFKLFGTFGLQLLFIIVQGIFIARHKYLNKEDIEKHVK